VTPPDDAMRKQKTGSDALLMLRKFLTQGTTVASWSPSSRAMARAITKDIDWATTKCVVELGAGTGPVTKMLVEAAGPNTRLVIIERDPDFCRVLRAKFPGHDIVEGDAGKLDEILAERGIAHADHVISGLPLPSFPKQLRDDVIAMSAKVLGPAGMFRQLTNMPYVYRGLYRSYFKNVAFKMVWRNFPPGGVYYCTGYQLAGS